jgi:hypothetical protein
MTIRDLFRFLIRLFSLYLLIILFFWYIPFIFLALKYFDFNENLSFIPISIGLILFIIFYFLIYKTDQLILIFKLDKDFENKQFKLSYLNAKRILKLSLIVVGSALILLNFSGFLSQLIMLFEQSAKNEINEFQTYGIETTTIKGINLLLGIMVLLRLNYFTKKIESLIING